ncbi:MAG: helix-hairpin-helix domain-containing protein [Methylococcales bacterium]|nr:helix-hairpin-helix domain-containing protein [Methylococcales bacterium]
MATELSVVNGLGKKTELHLFANGIKSVEELLLNGESILLLTPRMTSIRAQSIMRDARELVDVKPTNYQSDNDYNPANSTLDTSALTLSKRSKEIIIEGERKTDLTNSDDIEKRIIELKTEAKANLAQESSQGAEQASQKTELTPSRNLFDAFFYFISVAIITWFLAYPIYGILNIMEMTPIVSNWWFAGFFILGSFFAAYFYNDEDHHLKIIFLGAMLVMSVVAIDEDFSEESIVNLTTIQQEKEVNKTTAVTVVGVKNGLRSELQNQINNMKWISCNKKKNLKTCINNAHKIHFNNLKNIVLSTGGEFEGSINTGYKWSVPDYVDLVRIVDAKYKERQQKLIVLSESLNKDQEVVEQRTDILQSGGVEKEEGVTFFEGLSDKLDQVNRKYQQDW